MKEQHIMNMTNLVLITGGLIVMVGAVLKVFALPYATDILKTGLTVEAFSFIGVVIFAIWRHLK